MTDHLTEDPLLEDLEALRACPHDLSPRRLRQIAHDLELDGYYGYAANIYYVARKLELLEAKNKC